MNHNANYPPSFLLLQQEGCLVEKALKRDNRYQQDKKRKLCKRRAAIEPIIGHLRDFIAILVLFVVFAFGNDIHIRLVQ
jgi:IS5 family transposase